MKFLLLIILIIFTFTGCKKLIDVNPPVTAVTGESVYYNDATAIAVLTGLYSRISAAPYPGGFDLSTLSYPLGLSADEFVLWDGVDDQDQIAYYKNELIASSNSSAGDEFWGRLYSNIYICNAALEGLQSANSVTEQVKTQLIGEAKFMRALNYFYLINLFGDVPLILQTNYTLNTDAARVDRSVIYQQIINDLKDAADVLAETYRDISLLNETYERVRPNRWAAAALLARVYLYNSDWANAEKQATKVIENTALFHLPALHEVFLANSMETIWQLQPVTTGYVTNTWDGKIFIIPETGLNRDQPVVLSPVLLDTFENEDRRKTEWVSSVVIEGDSLFYPFKYKVNAADAPVTEYSMMLRLAEQYLIRAEARAQQGNIAGAQNDINVVRARAGLDNTPASDQPSLLQAILQERQVEFFSECGHRWLDLKRTGQINTVMSVVTEFKGGKWNNNWQWYPLPFGDIQKNSRLTQNDGY